jgi:hypothetical protein
MLKIQVAYIFSRPCIKERLHKKIEGRLQVYSVATLADVGQSEVMRQEGNKHKSPNG